MEKTPYQVLLCLKGTRGFQKDERIGSWSM